MNKELPLNQRSRSKSNKNKMPILRNFPFNKFVGRVVLLGALTYSSLFGGVVHNTENAEKFTKEAIVRIVNGFEGKSELPSNPKGVVAKRVTLENGNTVWSIATAEGPAVADSPANMYAAEQNIEQQLGGTNVKSGEEVIVAGYSNEGTPVYANDPQAKKDESILKNG